jgi:cytochrome d ubiquinol oxidase subunit II
MTALQVIWFFLLGVLFVGYAILDGFDLGVGFWHLGAKGDDERRAMLNAVGPVWDGNEVWLLTAGGALFGAFPAVYASVFSGFYLALMLVLLVLMARAISFEFRSQVQSPGWRGAWDVVFSVSSTVAILLFGVALGNILRGITLDPAGNYTGTFFGLLNPYALMIGVLGLAMLAFHGALYMVIKGSGELEERSFWSRRS